MSQGVVSLSEKYGGFEISPQSYTEMVEEVREHLQGFERDHALRRHFEAGEVQMLGMSGTVTTLAGVHMGFADMTEIWSMGSGCRCRKFAMWRAAIRKWIIMREWRCPVLEQERADLVVAGCAILEAITDLWPAQYCGWRIGDCAKAF